MPVMAGVLVSVTGQAFFDPLFALLVGTWILLTTALEVLRSTGELIWPEDASCPHDPDRATTAGDLRRAASGETS